MREITKVLGVFTLVAVVAFGGLIVQRLSAMDERLMSISDHVSAIDHIEGEIGALRDLMVQVHDIAYALPTSDPSGELATINSRLDRFEISVGRRLDSIEGRLSQLDDIQTGLDNICVTLNC